MKRVFISLCLFFCFSLKVQMPYKTAVGIRLGSPEGLSFKVGLKQNTALEGIIGLHPYGMSVTSLYEKYQASGIKKVQLFYGAGAHIGWNTYRNYYYRKDRAYFAYGNESFIGVDGVIGLEYKFDQVPFAISFDLKPALNFYQYSGAGLYLDPGLGLKAAF